MPSGNNGCNTTLSNRNNKSSFCSLYYFHPGLLQSICYFSGTFSKPTTTVLTKNQHETMRECTPAAGEQQQQCLQQQQQQCGPAPGLLDAAAAPRCSAVNLSPHYDHQSVAEEQQYAKEGLLMQFFPVFAVNGHRNCSTSSCCGAAAPDRYPPGTSIVGTTFVILELAKICYSANKATRGTTGKVRTSPPL